MKSFTNDVVDNWSVELDKDSTLSQFMPMLNFTLVNSGDTEVTIYLQGQRIGKCFGYATYASAGKPFESFRVSGTFNIGDIEVIVSKMETVATMPFNPQIDLMEENLDKFASGTDSRMSYSAATSMEIIKYWIGTQNSLIVQRKLDVLGGAAVGSYEADFGGDIISGSTAINFPSVDLKRYKKTISNSIFDYTLTNCTIKGLLLDYYKNPNDISDDYTVVTGADPSNAYDDDLTTYVRYGSWPSTWQTVLELSFDVRSISSIHTYLVTSAASASAYAKVFLEVDGVWTEIFSVGEAAYYLHDNTGWDLVTGVRFQLRNSNASSSYTTYINIYDLSIFP